MRYEVLQTFHIMCHSSHDMASAPLMVVVNGQSVEVAVSLSTQIVGDMLACPGHNITANSAKSIGDDSDTKQP
jgi:hypothetical protein